MVIKPILRKNLFIFVLSVSMICLIFSKFVLSMSLIGLLILIVFLRKENNHFVIHLNSALFQAESYKKLWPWTGFLLYFLWVVISLLWSSGEVGQWFHEVVGKLSLIGIPLIFLFIPRLSPKEILLLHYVFYGALIVACVMILTVYIPQYADINMRIGRGRPIPTPIDHVRFSIMVAYGGLSSLYYGIEAIGKGLRQKVKNGIIWVIFVFFFIMVHVLAVRSGLILLYSGILIFIAHKILIQKAWKLGILSIIAIILLPLVAYQYVPSFKNKISYTIYDAEQYFQNKQGNSSDSDRIMSIKNGIALWKESIILGYGAGNYKQTMIDYYEANLPHRRVLLPHNQWVRTGFSYGLIGVVILLGAFMFIVLGNKAYRSALLLMIFQLFFFSCLVESNLERYYGLVFFFLFIGLATMEWENRRMGME